MKTGTATSRERQFVGLENLPALPHGPRGRELQLHAARAGSLAIGAPVYFRQFQVGRVIDENLLPDGSARVSVFIDAPHDGFVKPVSRFWNASGIDVKLGADGLNVQTESLAAVLAGGIAFDDGPAEAVPAAAAATDEFALYKNEAEAMAPPDGDPRYVRMRFAQALRGLQAGAPVEFVGVNIGSVVAVDLGYESQDKSFPVIVTAKLYPRRMGQAYESLAAQGKTESDETLAAFVGSLDEIVKASVGASISATAGLIFVCFLSVAVIVSAWDGLHRAAVAWAVCGAWGVVVIGGLLYARKAISGPPPFNLMAAALARDYAGLLARMDREDS